ncbi:thioredoxin family protein [Pirellulaceae bacterium SH501]
MLRLAALMIFAFLDGSPSPALAVQGSKDKPLPYEVAYKKAQEEKKPLVVLVGADWCVACKTMKNDTIAPMTKSGQLKEVVFTQVDKDAQPELASQVMQGNTLPQIVVFCEDDKGWKRFSLTGMQTERRVKELIGKAIEILPKRR